MNRGIAIAVGVVVLAGILWLSIGDEAPPAPSVAPAAPAAPAVEEKSARPSLAPVVPAAQGVQTAKPITLAKQAPSDGQTAFEGAWGGKPGEFGRKPASESNPEAPMAIAAANKSVLVVDQVNHRVQRFVDGKPVAEFSISETIQDIAIGKDGKTVVLDRLADKNVKVFDASGKLVNEAPIQGKGIDEVGHVTGVFTDDEGIWVEKDHSTLVRVADVDGNTDEVRPEMPGRPSRDGSTVVTAAIFDRVAGSVRITAFVRETLEVKWSREVIFSMPILELLMLDSDRAGNVYIAAHIGREAPEDPFPIVEEVIEVVRLGPDGGVIGSIDLPVTNTGDEMQRPLAVGDDGEIYAMAPGEKGMSVKRYAIP